MKIEQLSFANSPLLFDVEIDTCRTLNCRCRNVVIKLRGFDQNDEEGDQDEKIIRFIVDVDRWEINAEANFDAATRSVINEFLEDFPLREVKRYRAEYDEKQAAIRRLAEYRIKPEEFDGKCVSFCEMIADRQQLFSGGPAGFMWFVHDDTTYFVDDQYCPNPDCKCEAVTLSFLQLEETRIAPRFATRLHLDSGKLRVEQIVSGTQAEAQELCEAWQDQNPNTAVEFRWRYDKVKEIGNRSPRPARKLPVPRDVEIATPLEIPARQRIGRNDLCPCGSGRKYKKCCGN